MSVRVCVCVSVRPSGKWLVEPSRTSNRAASFLFHLAIQNAATAFHCAGQMHRTRDARAVGCHSARFLLPFFGVNGSQRIMTQNRTRRRAASSEAFALYAIVAGCGRAPKTFPKRAHKRACSRLVRIM
jgi:hypothetical protein